MSKILIEALACIIENYLCEVESAIENGMAPPDHLTNGDVIKAMFPKAEFDNAMPFTDGRWEIMNLDTENPVRAIYKPTQLRTYADWWNAPYIRR